MSSKDIDDISGVETTGHSWDGIKELNNPLPRWWVWVFYATVVFSIGYCIYYPAWPLIERATEGIAGYSSRAELHGEIAKTEAARGEILARIAETPVESIMADNTLARFAVAGGASAFKVHCSQCHGSGAAGSPGYPNLNDDFWLWGGKVTDIYQTIKHGIRFEADEDTRYSEMPAFGRDELLTGEEIKATAHFVRQLASLEHDPELAAIGAAPYAENCAACHGEQGQGDPEQGAPNLADAIWHFGSETNQIAAQIRLPKHGVMPGWGDRLGDATVKQLAVFVHNLGGGE